MNDLEYRKQVLDPLSATFCAAKWYNATIWLGSGMTTSCHHPPAHLVDKDKVMANPRLLHNTDQKKQDRADMQEGKRPPGCEYCWKIEDMGRAAVSDRVYKSRIYPIQTLQAARVMPPDADVNLRTLEISFDRTCQFACSYCNPAFSTTWVKDIRRNGAYANLVSDGRNHYTHAHDASQLYQLDETNPYVEAFFAWWESDLHRTLQELRITGGEPLMSGYTWRLIDWFQANQGRSNTRLAINSNLGMSTERVQEFLDRIQGIPHVEIYTSNEAVGTHAEYIRDGLDWDQWIRNVNLVLNQPNVRALHSMCTINALCLDSLPKYLTLLMGLKQTYGRDRVSFTLNILRFPSFQSALVLPQSLKQMYRRNLEAWLEFNRENPLMHEHEIRHLQRLVDYLDVVQTPHSDSWDIAKLQHDFAHFYGQYDQRRGKNFAATFARLSKWYNDL